MSEKTYYQILQVDVSADPEVITAAYKRLAMKYHPDTNSDRAGATARMQELNHAYDVLNDPLKRAAYDRGLRASTPPQQQARPPQAGPVPPRAAPGAHAPSAGTSSLFTPRNLATFGALAVGLLVLSLVGFGRVSPIELLVIGGVALLLTRPVSEWLASRFRK